VPNAACRGAVSYEAKVMVSTRLTMRGISRTPGLEHGPCLICAQSLPIGQAIVNFLATHASRHPAPPARTL